MAVTKKQQTESREDAEKSPVVWLTVFEAAKRIGNFSMMERARRELASRGVIVQSAAAPATTEAAR